MKQSRPNQRPGKTHPEEDTYLELLRTTDLLSRGIAEVLKMADLSATQYNMLRILRGAPEGLTCTEIADRMITRDPDITRLLDRLEKRRLVSRSRQSKDRRMVLTRITTSGIRVLARIDLPVQQAHIGHLGHLGWKRLQLLTRLLRACRGEAA